MTTRSTYTIQKAATAYTSQTNDPRISQPEIKVYYPEEEKQEEPQKPSAIAVDSPANAQPTEQPPSNVKSQETRQLLPEQTLTIQQAIQQHWLAFGIAAVGIFALGFFIAKSRTT